MTLKGETFTGLKLQFFYFVIDVASVIEVLHGNHVGWQEQLLLFPMGTNVLSDANNFHCPAIQYGCRAKPLYYQSALVC